MIAVVSFYGLVLAGHIAANLVAFGVLFAWPMLPSGTAAAHQARRRILSNLVSYAALVALVAGAYLATDASAWGKLWVQVPLGIFVVLLGIVGGVMTRGERLLARTAVDGDRPDAAQYASRRRTVDLAAYACWVLVAAAVLTMTIKPSG